MKALLFLTIALSLISCKQDFSDQEDIDEVTLEHLVFFSLKDSLSEADVQGFTGFLKTLENIEGVIEVEVNSRTDMGDSRALDYDLLMTMELKDSSYLKSYAEDPYHLKVRDSLMPFLAAPPATFDMMNN